MRCPDLACDSIDFVAPAVDAASRVVENTIFSEYLVDSRAPARKIVFAEDVVKIADQQGRYVVGYWLVFSFTLVFTLRERILPATQPVAAKMLVRYAPSVQLLFRGAQWRVASGREAAQQRSSER